MCSHKLPIFISFLAFFIVGCSKYEQSAVIKSLDILEIAKTVAEKNGGEAVSLNHGGHRLPDVAGYTAYWQIQLDSFEKMGEIQRQIEDEVDKELKQLGVTITKYFGETRGDGREPFWFTYKLGNAVGEFVGMYLGTGEPGVTILLVFIHELGK
jgi:hypothetical protein